MQHLCVTTPTWFQFEEIGEAQGGLLGFHRLFLNSGMWIPKVDNKTFFLEGTTTPKKQPKQRFLYVNSQHLILGDFFWWPGGYYADLDVASVKPIRDYEVPKEANMIVGSLSEMGRLLMMSWGHRFWMIETC